MHQFLTKVAQLPLKYTEVQALPFEDSIRITSLDHLLKLGLHSLKLGLHSHQHVTTSTRIPNTYSDYSVRAERPQ